METLRAKSLAALEKFTIPSRLKSIKSRASVHFHRRQGKVMFLHLSVCSQKGREAERDPSYKKPHIQRPPPKKEHGTREEVTSYITPAKNIGPDRNWHHTPRKWHLVAATVACWYASCWNACLLKNQFAAIYTTRTSSLREGNVVIRVCLSCQSVCLQEVTMWPLPMIPLASHKSHGQASTTKHLLVDHIGDPPKKKHGPHYLTTRPCSIPVLPIRLAHTSIGKRLVGLQLKDFLVSRYYYVAFTCRY